MDHEHMIGKPIYEISNALVARFAEEKGDDEQ